MSNLYSITVRNMLELGTGRRVSLKGTGTTATQALNELKSKMKVTIAAFDGKTSISTTAPSTAVSAADLNGGTVFSDATIEVKRTGGTQVSAPINLQNINVNYAVAGTDGLIDITNADIIDLGVKHVDNQGNNDYIVIGGHFGP